MSDHFRESFEALARERKGDALQPLREAAMERFAADGLPGSKDEEWRFTNVAPIARAAFPIARPGANGVSAADVERLGLGGESEARLVFVDGHYRPELSTPGGIHAESLAAALARDPDRVMAHLGKLASWEGRPFVALNTAFVEDGVFLHLPKAACYVRPIHLLYVGTGKSCFPRNLIVAEESAHATIVESWVSLAGEGQFTDVVTEIVVGANASVDHCRLQLENHGALHVSTTHVHQGRDSNYTSHTVTLGGRLVRNDIDAALDAENITCTLNGLFLTRAGQHVDNHTLLEHKKPHCESHELYKGILDGKSSAVFRGKIHVFQDAQKTDAKQSSAGLLLSDDAVLDAKPQLEIYADDVKCTHGATIGQLDPTALFYLRSRGLPEAEAHDLLLQAFAADITERIRVPSVRGRIETLLRSRLPGGG